MRDPVEHLEQIISTLCDLPEFLKDKHVEKNNMVDAAFTLGCVVAELEYLKESLKNRENS